MAKLHGAAKAAFLARMARGRKAKKGGGKSRRSRKRRSNPKHRHWGHVSAHQRRVNPRKRRKHVRARRKRHARARRRSNPIAYLVNPGGTMARKHRKHRRRPSNPHRKHRRRHHARRRNPSIMGVAQLTKVLIPAAGAGFVSGFIEAKFLTGKSKIIKVLARVVEAVAAGTVLRRNPAAAGAAIGALLGPIGGDFGSKAGGGPGQLGDVGDIASAIAGNEDVAAIIAPELEVRGLGLIMSEGGSMTGTEDQAGFGEGSDLDGSDDA